MEIDKQYYIDSANLYNKLTNYSEKSAENENNQIFEGYIDETNYMLKENSECKDKLMESIGGNLNLYLYGELGKTFGNIAKLSNDIEKTNQKARQLIKQFDFMEGKDANDFNDYLMQIDKLVTGQLFVSDENIDSKIDYDEFLKQNEGQPEEAKNREIFDKYDYDGDGQIEYEELATLYWMADIIGDGGEDGKFINHDIEDALKILDDVKQGKSSKKTAENVEEIYKFLSV